MRLAWDEYFLSFLNIISTRATCNRGRSACVIVDNENRIVSTGYVGSPSGSPHCDDVGHLFDNNSQHCLRTIHAEVNAIAQAAKRGVSTNNSTLYVTMEPCKDCAKLIIQSGITKVICLYEYHAAKLSRFFFEQSNVELITIHKTECRYE